MLEDCIASRETGIFKLDTLCTLSGKLMQCAHLYVCACRIVCMRAQIIEGSRRVLHTNPLAHTFLLRFPLRREHGHPKNISLVGTGHILVR